MWCIWETLRWDAMSKERFLSLHRFVTFLFTIISFLNTWLDFCPLYSKAWITVEHLLYLISFGLHLKGIPGLSKLRGIIGADLISFELVYCLILRGNWMAQSVFCQGEIKQVLWFKKRLLRGTLARRCLGDMAATLIGFGPWFLIIISMWPWWCWLKKAVVFSRPKQLPVFLVSYAFIFAIFRWTCNENHRISYELSTVKNFNYCDRLSAYRREGTQHDASK